MVATTKLNESGLLVTLDHLGEHVENSASAKDSAAAYFPLLEHIDRIGAKAGISLKLTQLGLLIDYDLCLENIKHILDYAEERSNFVRIDIEDSPVIERTIQLFKDLRESSSKCVGIAIQSYLFRSEADTHALLHAGARIRLVKGAYQEPPEIAYSNTP